MITSWIPWNCRSTVRSASSDSARSSRVSPIPMSRPVVGDADDRRRPAPAAPAGPYRVIRGAGPGVSNNRLLVVPSIIPMLGATGRNRLQLLPGHHSRVGVREHAGLLEDGHRDRPHVVDRGVVAPGVQPRTCCRPTVLRRIPECQQRLGTTGLCAAGRDRHGPSISRYGA